MEDIHKDLLAEHDKASYGKCKSGLTENPPGYEDAILKEQEMVAQSMANYMGSTSAQTYVTDVNGKLYDLLLHKQPIPAKASLPSSPESSSPKKPAVIYIQGSLASNSAKSHRQVRLSTRRPMMAKPRP